jgi:hypothetical protein
MQKTDRKTTKTTTISVLHGTRSKTVRVGDGPSPTPKMIWQRLRERSAIAGCTDVIKDPIVHVWRCVRCTFVHFPTGRTVTVPRSVHRSFSSNRVWLFNDARTQNSVGVGLYLSRAARGCFCHSHSGQSGKGGFQKCCLTASAMHIGLSISNCGCEIDRPIDSRSERHLGDPFFTWAPQASARTSSSPLGLRD